MTGLEKLRAALKRLRPKKTKPKQPTLAEDEWSFHVETRLAALENKSRSDRLFLVAVLLLHEAAGRLHPDTIARLLDFLK